MFKSLLKGIVSALAFKLLDNYRHLSVQLLRIEAAKAYLHGVRLARLSAIGLVRVGLFLALICVGVLLLHVGLFILLPWTVPTKALLCMFLGAAYVVIGGAVLYAAMDERKWTDKSGAAEMLEEVTRHSQIKRPERKECAE